MVIFCALFLIPGATLELFGLRGVIGWVQIPIIIIGMALTWRYGKHRKEHSGRTIVSILLAYALLTGITNLVDANMRSVN